MIKNQRLLGIDLWRGIAAYAVILVHSGDETWGIPITENAIQFRSLFYFAVPFFLATSFFLMTAKATINLDGKFWLSRIERILIPYIVWTIIYVVLKVITFPLTNQTEQLATTLQDPLAIIFLGGASYHLYFLPLLFTGCLLLFLARYLKEKQFKLINLLLLSLVSAIAYQLLIWSNNSFILGSNIAFASILNLLSPDNSIYSLVRIVLVAIAWLLRCLPYLLTALTLHYFFSQTDFKLNNKITLIFLFIYFLVISYFNKTILPEAFFEITVAYSLLLFSIGLSSYLKFNFLIANLGKCSFGIYLIHPFIKSIIEIIIQKSIPSLSESISIASIIIYSSLTFIVSWIIVSNLITNKFVAKYMFGN